MCGHREIALAVPSAGIELVTPGLGNRAPSPELRGRGPKVQETTCPKRRWCRHWSSGCCWHGHASVVPPHRQGRSPAWRSGSVPILSAEPSGLQSLTRDCDTAASKAYPMMHPISLGHSPPAAISSIHRFCGALEVAFGEMQASIESDLRARVVASHTELAGSFWVIPPLTERICRHPDVLGAALHGEEALSGPSGSEANGSSLSGALLRIEA